MTVYSMKKTLVFNSPNIKYRIFETKKRRDFKEHLSYSTPLVDLTHVLVWKPML